MIFPARGTGIVGREETGNAVAVVQLSQVGRTSDDVVVRVIWIGAETVALAQANVVRLSLNSRIIVRQGDLFAAFGNDNLAGAVDMIVCNPPYISSSRLDSKSAYLLDDEPREAFDGGPYGISILQRLVREAVDFLKPGGWLLCEFGEGQERQVTALLARTKAYEDPSFGFVDDKPRVMVARIRADGPAGTGAYK